MPETLAVTAPAARRFLAQRHLLAPPRSLLATPDSVLTVIGRLGSFQFDPLVIAGRNHDLILHARVRDYRPAWTDELLYDRRLLFEAWNKGLSLVPVRELPWYRIAWDRERVAHDRTGTFERHADLVAQILARIEASGPRSALDFERGADIEWYWRPTNQVRAMLEALWEVGRLAIARRRGNLRLYDLAERVYPPALLTAEVPTREQLLHKLLSRYRAHGLLGTGGQSELWIGIDERLDDGTRRAGPLRAELVSELLDRQQLVPVAVAGVRGTRFILADELPLLRRAEADLAQAPRPDGPAAEGGPGGGGPGVAFLAPLDPLVWDRDLLRSLYRFDYVWEVYVPESKRRWGYYVLPILFGDRLVGRLEPRLDRKADAVRIVGVWWEEGFDARSADGFVPAMREALGAYRRFGRLGRIEWAPGLERWRRLFGTRGTSPKCAPARSGANG